MINMMTPRLACALTLCVSSIAAAQAADPSLYLNITSVTTGRDAPLDGPIVLDSLSWGASNSGTTHVGGGAGIGASSVQDIGWSQAMDISTPLLSQAVALGSRYPGAQFDLVAPGAAKPYLSLATSTSLITKIAFSGSTVAGSLNSSAITLRYDPAARGESGPTVATSFDIPSQVVTGATSRTAVAVSKSEVLTPAAAAGSTGIYLRLGDTATQIAGDSRAAGYENWMSLDSAELDMSQSGSLHTGAGGGAGKANVGDLSWTQQIDASLPAFFGVLASGKLLGQATLEYVAMGAAGPVTFMQLVLQDVLLKSLQIDGSSQASQSLNFGAMTQTVWQINADGTRGASSGFSFDIAANRTIAPIFSGPIKYFGNGSLAPTALVTSIPEPGTWMLMLAGVGLLAGLARTRRSHHRVRAGL